MSRTTPGLPLARPAVALPAIRSALVALALLVRMPGATESTAATYRVLPDGSGEYPTIQAAIDAARDGDVVLLGYGRFTGPGNRDLHYDGKAITIRSQSGHPETCIIDCEGSTANISRGFVFDGEGPGSVLQGVTIENGFVDDASLPFLDSMGGGALFVNGASPTLRNVTFRHCGAFAAGGVGIYAGSPRFENCGFFDNGACGGGGGYCFDGAPEFIGCLFENNHPLQSGGGITISGADSATFTDCVFRNNSCLHCGLGGGLALSWTTATVTRCTFIGNRTYESGDARGGSRNCTGWGFDRGRDRDCEGGAIGVNDAHVVISNCTIVGNAAPSGGGIGIDSWASDASVVEIVNTIIAFNTEGGALSCSSALDQVSLHCTDIFGNAGGDWIGCIADQQGVHRNLSADPLFCGLASGDLTLDELSPCADYEPGGCWLIGAWPVGCGSEEVPDTGGSASGAGSLRVAPNPAIGECRVVICGRGGGLAKPGVAAAEAGTAVSGRGESLDSGARGWKGVTLQVLDVAGRVVRDLPLETARADGGCIEARWDSRDNRGRLVPSGIYVVRAGTAGGEHARLVLRR